MGTYGAHTYCSTFIIYISSNDLIPLAKHLTISRLGLSANYYFDIDTNTYICIDILIKHPSMF